MLLSAQDQASLDNQTSASELANDVIEDSYKEIAKKIESIESALKEPAITHDEILELSTNAIELYRRIPLLERKLDSLQLIRGLASHHLQAAEAAYALKKLELSENHCIEAIELVSEIPDEKIETGDDDFVWDIDMLPTKNSIDIKTAADLLFLKQCQNYLDQVQQKLKAIPPVAPKQEQRLVLSKYGIKHLRKESPNHALKSLKACNKLWEENHPDEESQTSLEARRFLNELHNQFGLAYMRTEKFDDAYNHFIISLTNAFLLHEDNHLEGKNDIINACKYLSHYEFVSTRVFGFVSATLRGHSSCNPETIRALLGSYEGFSLEEKFLVARDMSMGLRIIKSFSNAYAPEDAPFKKWLRISGNDELLEKCLFENADRHSLLLEDTSIDSKAIISSMLSALKEVFEPSNGVFEEIDLTDPSENKEKENIISEITRHNKILRDWIVRKDYVAAVIEVKQIMDLSDKIPAMGDTYNVIIPALLDSLLALRKYNQESTEKDMLGASVLHRLGFNYYLAGNYIESKIHLENSLEMTKGVIDEHSQEEEDCLTYTQRYYHLGRTYLALGNHEATYDNFTKALQKIYYLDDELDDVILEICRVLKSSPFSVSSVYQFAHRAFSNDVNLTEFDLSNLINQIGNLEGNVQDLHVKDLVTILALFNDSVSNRLSSTTRFNNWFTGEKVLEIEDKLEDIATIYVNMLDNKNDPGMRNRLMSQLISKLKLIVAPAQLSPEASKGFAQNSLLAIDRRLLEITCLKPEIDKQNGPKSP